MIRRLLQISITVFACGMAGCAALPSLIETASPVLTRQAAIGQVWPGFWPAEQAFLLYEPQGNALLYTPVKPPPGYLPFEVKAESAIPEAFRSRLYFHEGVPAGLKGVFNTSYAVGDVTATAMNLEDTVYRTLDTLFHETFHTYQKRHFSEYGEGSQFVDPQIITPSLAAKAEVERRILRVALQLSDQDRLRAVAQLYLAVRQEREQEMPAMARKVEARMERSEGSALLVGAQAAGVALKRSPERVGRYIREGYLALPLKRFPGSIQERLFRWRLYGTGAAIGLLLDRLGAENWRGRLEAGESFEAMLAEAVHFDAVSDPKALARATLQHFDYQGILRALDQLWGSTDVPTIEDFYEAPAFVIVTFPDAAEGMPATFTAENFYQLAEKLTLIEASLLDVNLSRFSLTVYDREVLLDWRKGLRLTIALPALPEVGTLLVPSDAVRLERLELESQGLEIRAHRTMEVTISPDSIVIHILP